MSICILSHENLITSKKKQIKTNYKTQFLINSMLKDEIKKNQLKKDPKK